MKPSRRRVVAAGLALVAAGLALALWGVPPLRRAAPDVRAEQREQLAALGYVSEVTDELDAGRSGVVVHDAARAWPGVNVYCSMQGDRARFLDMDGRELHAISLPETGEGAGCVLEPYGERSFLALSAPSLALLDFDSRVHWQRDDGYHHDVSTDAQGRVWALLQRRATLSLQGFKLPVADHFLVRLGPDGAWQQELALSELFGDAVAHARLARAARLLRAYGPRSPRYVRVSDVLHFNTVEVLDRDIAVARRGDVLLCARELDLVAIVDPDARSVVWRWGPGQLDRPHHPSLLPNGNLLIFDNGKRRGWSRLLELEPASGRIVWQHRGQPPNSFFSPVRGSAQALPNGNVLVTESTRGRVFEVTRDGSVVWSFLNPDQRDGRRRQLYRMERVPLERFAAWTSGAPAP